MFVSTSGNSLRSPSTTDSHPNARSKQDSVIVVEGNETHQLSSSFDVIVDKERFSLTICDYAIRRVIRWHRRYETSGETIISNISCRGLTMDENGSLYVTDEEKYEVRRHRRGESQGTVVAGGNGEGNRLDQLSLPHYVFVDRDHSVMLEQMTISIFYLQLFHFS